MPNRVQRLLRGWRRSFGLLRRREPPEGEGETQDVSRFPAASGEMPAPASRAERNEPVGFSDGRPIPESTAAFARDIRARLRLGIGGRVIHHARRASLSEPRALAHNVAPTAIQRVQMTPLPLAGVPSDTGLNDGEGRDAGLPGGAMLGQSTGDAAWDALWALRGAHGMPDAGPGRARESTVTAGQQVIDQEVAHRPETTGRTAEPAAELRRAPSVPVRRQSPSRHIQTRGSGPVGTRPEPGHPTASRPLGRRVTELGTVRHPQGTETSSPVSPGAEPERATPEPRREAPKATEPPVRSTLASPVAGEAKAPPSAPGEIARPAAAPGAMSSAGLPGPVATEMSVASGDETQEPAEPADAASPPRAIDSSRRQRQPGVRAPERTSRVQRAKQGMPKAGPGEPPEGGRGIGTQEEPGELQPAVSVSEMQVSGQTAPPAQEEQRVQIAPTPAISSASQVTASGSAQAASSSFTQAQAEGAALEPQALPEGSQVPVATTPRRQPAAQPVAPSVTGAQPPVPSPAGPRHVQREMDGGARPHAQAPVAEALSPTPAGMEPGSSVESAERARRPGLLVGLRRFLPLRRLARQRPPAPRATEAAQEPFDSSSQRPAVSDLRSTADRRWSEPGLQGPAPIPTTTAPVQASQDEVSTATAPDLARRTIRKHRPQPLLGRTLPVSLPLVTAPAQRTDSRRASRQAGKAGLASAVGGELDQQMSESGGLQEPAGGAQPDVGYAGSPNLMQPVGGPSVIAASVVRRAIRGPGDLRQLRRSILQPMVVQRAVDEPSGAGAPSTASAPGPATEAEPGSGGPAAGQDLEAMAQEVYHIIRRRLAVERERLRGGL